MAHGCSSLTRAVAVADLLGTEVLASVLARREYYSEMSP
jgi:hypothetical protein